MSVLLTIILVVLLFAVMGGSFAYDETRRLGRRVKDVEARLAGLEARTQPLPRLVGVPAQRDAG